MLIVLQIQFDAAHWHLLLESLIGNVYKFRTS